MKDIIITRHKSTVNYLKKKFGLENAEVKPHITEDDIEQLKHLKGCRVFGVLPIHLIDEIKKKTNCDVFITIPPNIPPELRGKDLTEEELDRLGGIKIFRVDEIKLKKVDYPFSKKDEEILSVIQDVEELSESHM